MRIRARQEDNMGKKREYFIAVACVFILLFGSPAKRETSKTDIYFLEKILTIDTENDDTAARGLTDISYFDIDSEGKIFIGNVKAKEHFIFILDKDGSLLSACGGMGQGPGELQSLRELAVTKQDEIFATDREKVVVFSNSGQFIREFRIETDYQKIIPLDEERYLAIAVKMNEDLSQSFEVILCSSGLEEIKTLDRSKIESFQKAVKVNIIPTLVHWEKSNKYIFTGNTDKYEIRKFNFEGDLVTTIKKEHKAMPLSAEDKKEYQQRLKRYPDQIRDSFFIPDTFPPFRDFAAVDDQWLLVQTYEESETGGSLYDIFDSSGAYKGRTELAGSRVKFKGGKAYSLRQKESGYKELLVYRLN